MAAVRVGISMLTLVPGKMGGSESYARDLCRGLIARTDVDVVAFVPRTARFAGEGLPSTVVPCHSFGQDRFKSAAVMTQLAMRGRTRRLFDALDVVHYPFTVPIPSRALPSVVTLHDLQHLDMPEMFSWQTRRFDVSPTTVPRSMRRGSSFRARSYGIARSQFWVSIKPASAWCLMESTTRFSLPLTSVVNSSFFIRPASGGTRTTSGCLLRLACCVGSNLR